MREIKFRAWNIERKKMLSFEREGDDGVFLWRVGNLDSEEGWIVMQFIGLKDKNNKEIYEGDIVKVHGNLHVVEYDESSYSFQMGLSQHVLDQECSFSSKDFEVVGNIYENPELLKEK